MTAPVQRRPMARWLKALGWVVALAVIVVVLFTTVFPWLDRNVLNNPTLSVSAAALL